MKLVYLKTALKCDSFNVTIGIKIAFFRVSVTIEPDRSLLQFVATNCLKKAPVSQCRWLVPNAHDQVGTEQKKHQLCSTINKINKENSGSKGLGRAPLAQKALPELSTWIKPNSKLYHSSIFLCEF